MAGPGLYVDCQLPFGLASSPAIFCAVVEAFEWILRSRGVQGIMHYLDDFLLLGSPGTQECEHALQITRSTCLELGIPLALDKIEGRLHLHNLPWNSAQFHYDDCEPSF